MAFTLSDTYIDIGKTPIVGATITAYPVPLGSGRLQTDLSYLETLSGAVSAVTGALGAYTLAIPDIAGVKWSIVYPNADVIIGLSTGIAGTASVGQLLAAGWYEGLLPGYQHFNNVAVEGKIDVTGTIRASGASELGPTTITDALTTQGILAQQPISAQDQIAVKARTVSPLLITSGDPATPTTIFEVDPTGHVITGFVPATGITGQLTGTQIANDAISAAHLGAGVVGAGSLGVAAVTAPALAALSVTTPALADKNVLASKLGSEAATANAALMSDGAGGAAYRALTPTDIPSLDAGILGAGTLDAARLPIPTLAAPGGVLADVATGGSPQVFTAAGFGQDHYTNYTVSGLQVTGIGNTTAQGVTVLPGVGEFLAPRTPLTDAPGRKTFSGANVAALPIGQDIYLDWNGVDNTAGLTTTAVTYGAAPAPPAPNAARLARIRTSPLAPTAAPTVVGQVGGSTLTAGTYQFVTTWAGPGNQFVGLFTPTIRGESTASPLKTFTLVTTGNSIKVTVAAFPTGVGAANVYMSNDGGATYWYQGDIVTSGGSLVITSFKSSSSHPPTAASIVDITSLRTLHEKPSQLQTEINLAKLGGVSDNATPNDDVMATALLMATRRGGGRIYIPAVDAVGNKAGWLFTQPWKVPRIFASGGMASIEIYGDGCSPSDYTPSTQGLRSTRLYWSYNGGDGKILLDQSGLFRLRDMDMKSLIVQDQTPYILAANTVLRIERCFFAGADGDSYVSVPGSPFNADPWNPKLDVVVAGGGAGYEVYGSSMKDCYFNNIRRALVTSFDMSNFYVSGLTVADGCANTSMPGGGFLDISGSNSIIIDGMEVETGGYACAVYAPKGNSTCHFRNIRCEDPSAGHITLRCAIAPAGTLPLGATPGAGVSFQTSHFYPVGTTIVLDAGAARLTSAVVGNVSIDHVQKDNAALLTALQGVTNGAAVGGINLDTGVTTPSDVATVQTVANSGVGLSTAQYRNYATITYQSPFPANAHGLGECVTPAAQEAVTVTACAATGQITRTNTSLAAGSTSAVFTGTLPAAIVPGTVLYTNDTGVVAGNDIAAAEWLVVDHVVGTTIFFTDRTLALHPASGTWLYGPFTTTATVANTHVAGAAVMQSSFKAQNYLPTVAQTPTISAVIGIGTRAEMVQGVQAVTPAGTTTMDLNGAAAGARQFTLASVAGITASAPGTFLRIGQGAWGTGQENAQVTSIVGNVVTIDNPLKNTYAGNTVVEYGPFTMVVHPQSAFSQVHGGASVGATTANPSYLNTTITGVLFGEDEGNGNNVVIGGNQLPPFGPPVPDALDLSHAGNNLILSPDAASFSTMPGTVIFPHGMATRVTNSRPYLKDGTANTRAGGYPDGTIILDTGSHKLWSFDGGKSRPTVYPVDATPAGQVAITDGLSGVDFGYLSAFPSGGIASLAASAYRTAILADNPLLFYRLDESPGSAVAYDLGTLDATGTVTGPVTFGQPGGAADKHTGATFGTGAAITGGNAAIAAGSPFTLEFSVVANGWNPSTGQTVMATSATNKIAVNTSAQVSFTNGAQVITGSGLGVAGAHLVHVVYDGTNIVIYIDNAQKNSAVPTVTPSWTGTTFIGAQDGAGTNPANQVPISNVAVYGAALSSTQRAAHLTAFLQAGPRAGFEADLLSSSTGNEGLGVWTTLATPTVTPTIPVDGGAGNVNAGSHDWAWTSVYGSAGESQPGPHLTYATATGGTGARTLTFTAPAFALGVTAMNLYRSKVGTTNPPQLVGTVSTSGGTIVDNLADTSLGTFAPLSGSANVFRANADGSTNQSGLATVGGLRHSGLLGFYGGPLVTKQSLTGALSAVTDVNAKALLTSIVTALANLTLVSNNTT